MSSPASPRPPSVERVLAAVRRRVEPDRDASAVLAVAREVVAAERERLRPAAGGARPGAGPLRTAAGSGRTTSPAGRSAGELAGEVLAKLAALGGSDADRAPGPASVLNATGVILHTNLGRAPWPAVAIQAASAAARSYSLLELDVGTGRRGPRFRAAEEHLVALTGAEDALVVNNNAGAVALAVGLAGRKGVAVSRGELVEIGGGVRIPEIIRRAGARLVEVGTTNRTRVDDFREPLASGRASVVLRVHPSNFRQAGFVESPDPSALAGLAHASGAILVDDLGSGAFLDTARFGLPHEPTPAEALALGADLVTFSGDKLVGGPQAGLIVGRAGLVRRLRTDPLARAMRPDKALLAAIASTIGLYRAGLATREIPVWRMVAAPVEGLRERARALVELAGPEAGIAETVATLGGGSLPGEGIRSVAVVIRGDAPDRILARLRTGRPGVIGRIQDGMAILDLRTVDPIDDEQLLAAVRRVLGR